MSGLLKKKIIHSSNGPNTPYAESLCKKSVCETLTKALLKSRYNMSKAFPESKILVHSLHDVNRLVRTDHPGKNPC